MREWMLKIAAACMLAASCGAYAAVTHTSWGTARDGQPVSLYTLSNGGLTVQVTTYGARVVSIEAPDRNGKRADVVLGYDNLAQYEADHSTYFGAIVGRYGNRIAKGTFSIDGKTYQIPVNNGVNALHGGPIGFDQKVWTAREIPSGVEMTLVSPDGDMGFPGQLTAQVRYTLEGRSLHINYSATTTRPTVVNLTNHSYFNLHGSGSVLDQKLMINADAYTPVDGGLIPTGELAPVAGTPFDFRKLTAIGARIHDDNQQLKIAGGYDHNFVLNAGKGGGLHLVARAVDPASGRSLTVMTTEPGVQFYSGNFLDGTLKGKGGQVYNRNAAFCLETQHYPDSPNHSKFPSTVLRPGVTLHSTTIFTFGIEK